MRYETADLVIVGGGLPATLTACEAVRRGLSVLMVEQGRPGVSRHEITGNCLRLLHPDLARVRLNHQARLGWLEFEQQVGEQLLTPGEAVDIALDTRLDELQEHLDREGLDYTRLNRTRWPVVPFEGQIQALVTKAARLAVTPAWQGSWTVAQRAGVRIFADTPIRFLDLEYDRLTAVGHDTAFRGTSMLVTVASLLPDLPVRRVPQHWEWTKEALACPPLLYHFGGTPVQVVTEPGYRVSRCVGAEERDEAKRVHEFLARRLPQAPPTEEKGTFASELTPDGNLLLDRHGFRPDLFVLAGLADVGPQLAPALAPLALDLINNTRPLPSSFGFARFVSAESSSPGGRSPSP